MPSSFNYRILVEETPGGQREVRFHRLTEDAPRLDALYGSTDELSSFKHGEEVSIDPDEHAKGVAELRARREEEQASRQAESMKSLGIAPEESDGIAEKSTVEARPKPAQRTPPPVESKLPQA